MRKTILTLSILITLFLSACAGERVATQRPETSPVSAVENIVQSTVVEGAPADTDMNQITLTTAAPAADTENVETQATSTPNLSELQLLLGTLKLSGSDNPITTEQAATLLTLWSQLQTLSANRGPGQPNSVGTSGNDTSQTQGSETDIQEQITQLLTQTQSILTPAQVQAIFALDITQENAMTFIQDLGITMGSPQAVGPGGGGPGGGQQPPGGSDQQGNLLPPQGGQQSPQGTPPSGTPGSMMDNNAGSLPGGMIPPGLIDSVIQMLQKTSSASE